MSKPTLIFLLIFSPLAIFPLQDAFAIRPFFVTENAIPVAKGNSRLEYGIRYDRLSSNHKVYTETVELTYGIMNDIDFEVEVPYIYQRRDRSGLNNIDGLGDLKIKSKLIFLKGREANPLSLSGQVIVKFPTCNEKDDLSKECSGETDIGFTAIASKEYYPLTVHLNMGYLSVRKFKDVFNYSLAFEYNTGIRGIKIVTEIAGETVRNRRIAEFSEDPLFLWTSATYDIGYNIIVDTGLGVGLTNSSPDYTSEIGASYNF